MTKNAACRENYWKRLFGPFSSGGVIPLGEFLILLQKSYAYLRERRYRVLSTELPDDLLQKWLMPMPDEKRAEEYKRSFARQNDTLCQTELPVLVFRPCSTKTLQQGYIDIRRRRNGNRGQGFKEHVSSPLNYIFGMREAGRPLIEFDIFERGELRRNHRTNRSAGSEPESLRPHSIDTVQLPNRP